MSLTANQARIMAIGGPLLSVAIAFGASYYPALSSARQQSGNAERSAQLKAVATDYLAQRCYTSKEAPLKGLPITGIPDRLRSTCIYGGGWVGFITVKENEPIVLEVFTNKELNAQLSLIKEGK